MRRLLTPGWLALHVLVFVLVPVFLRLGWWQWERATAPGGLMRSYAYALQWPLFALFGIAMWVKMMRDELGGSSSEHAESSLTVDYPPQRPTDVGADSGIGDEDDDELAAYNRYLAGLNSRASQPSQR